MTAGHGDCPPQERSRKGTLLGVHSHINPTGREKKMNKRKMEHFRQYYVKVLSCIHPSGGDFRKRWYVNERFFATMQEAKDYGIWLVNNHDNVFDYDVRCVG